MSPQRSNRSALLEGALRCLERLPAERVTAREIAAEADANPASIAYHFGSKDELVTEAVIEGLDRWLDELERELGTLGEGSRDARLMAAAELIETTRRAHEGLARNLLGAMVRAQHEPRVRKLLEGGVRRTRPAMARVLGLGGDQAGDDAAGLVHAMFTGLLFQVLIAPELAIEGDRMEAAQARLHGALPR